MLKLENLIDEAKRALIYHRSRGASGEVEALAARVRIQALQDAKKAIEEDAQKKPEATTKGENDGDEYN